MMRNLQKEKYRLFLFVVLAILSGLFGKNAFSQVTGDYQTTGTGAKSWNLIANWQRYNGTSWVAATNYPGQIAGTGTVTITNNVQMTLNVSPANNIGSLAFAVGTTVATTMNLNGNTLNVTGDVSLNNPGGTNGDQTLTVGTGTLNCASLTLSDTDSSNEDLIISISTGTVNVSGSILMSGATSENAITFTGSGFLNIGGNMTGTGTFTAATSTVTYSGNAPTFYGTTYHNLYYTGNGTTATPTGTIAVRGDLTNTGGGTLNFGNRAVTITGTTANQNIAGFTTTGIVTMNKTAGTATLTSDMYIYRLTMSGSGGTLDLGSGLTHTITDRWTRTNGILNCNSSLFKLGNTFSGTGGTFNAGTGTVEYYRLGSQTIASVIYNNLVTSGSGTKTLGGAVSVNGNLSINAGILTDNGFQITGNTGGSMSMAVGTRINLGTTTVATSFPTNFLNSNISLAATSAVNYNSNLSQTIFDSIEYGHLILTATAGAVTKTVAGPITIKGNLTIGTRNTLSGGANVITVKGNVANSGSHSSTGAGKLLLSGGSAVHAISGGTSNFGHLELDDAVGATFTSSGTTTITGNLNVTSGTLTANGFTTSLIVNGTSTVDGTLRINSTTGTRRFVGLVTVNSGGYWNNSANGAVNFRGGITNDGTFAGGTGTNTFETNSQALSGSSTMYFGATVAISGAITLTNNTNVTVVGALTGSIAGATWTNAANSTLNARNAVLTTAGTILNASANGNTVNLEGGAQTAKVPSSGTFYNLTLAGSSTKTLNSAIKTINGNFTLSGSATVSGVTGLTIGGDVILGSGTSFINGNYTHNVAGNWTNNGGTYTPGTGTVNFNNSGADQSINGTATSQTFNNLTVAKGSTSLLLGGSTTALNVNSTLTMSSASGNINLGAGTLQLGTSTANVGTLNYTSGTIIGSFKRWIASAGTLRFPVGTASNIQNALVTFTDITGGSLTTRFVATDPGATGLPLSESGYVIGNQFTEGYWELIAANGLSSTNYTLALTGNGFTSRSFDTDVRLIKRPNGGGSWVLEGTHVAAASQTANRSGLSGFGEFAFGSTNVFPSVTFTSASQSSANETGTITITAQLSAASALPVTVPFTVNGSSTASVADYTIAVSPITINAGSTTGTITITITDDLIDENNETVVVNMGIPTNATQGSTLTHTATITDDDNPPTVTFTAASQSGAENGGSITVTLQLSVASSFNISVPFTVSASSTGTGGGTDYSITASPVSIPAGSTSVNLTITLNNDNLIEGNETVIINMGTPTNATQGAITSHTATIIDDENPPLVNFSASSSASASETGNITLTVTLSAASTLTVTVPFTVNGSSTATGGTDYSITASPLSFAPGVTSRTIVITISPDDYAEGNETVIVNLGTPTNGTLGATATHTATITDDDTAGFTFSATSGIVTTESGGTGSFTVRLKSRPTGDVVILFVSSDISEGTVSAATLTFSNTDWSTPQSITVIGVDDLFDDGNVTYTINTSIQSSADGNYLVLDPPDVVCTNTDNDTKGITVSPTSLSTTEATGASHTATFSIKLNTAPTAVVTIGLTSGNTNEGTIDKSSLVFTSIDWNTPQVVTITAVDDAVDDGDMNYTITTDAAVGGDYNGLVVADISVTNIDDDTKGFTIGTISGNTTEAGGTAIFTVALNSQPTADVTLTLYSNNTAEGTVSPTTLLFTTSNWASPQDVTVTGVDDPVDDGDIPYAIIFNPATGGDYAGLNPAGVTVINDDNDVRGVTVSAISRHTTEAGITASYTVVLNTQPTATVTIPFYSDNLLEGTVSTSPLVFDSGNWNTPQEVIVTGVDDDYDDGNVSFKIINQPAQGGFYAGLAVDDVDVTNDDNDDSGFLIVPSSGLTTTEAGGTATFTVKLTSKPYDDVRIDLTSSNTNEGTVSPAFLLFKDSDWNSNQLVTITGVNDDVDDGDVDYSIGISQPISSDNNYFTILSSTISVKNTDDDTAGIFISPTSGLVTNEGGGTASFVMRLLSKPLADVSISLNSSTTSEGTLAVSSVVFTPTTWNANQTIVITGADDVIIDGNKAYTIETGNSVSTDPKYNNIVVPDVAVTNNDNDVAAILVDPVSDLETGEDGTQATFTVVLSSQPTAEVTIPISSSNTVEGTVVGSIVFQPALWNIPITLTISGANDAVADGDKPYSIILGNSTSIDANFNNINPADVAVTNIDDDEIGVVIGDISGNTTEAAGVATFTIRLKSQPTASVTIGLLSSNTLEGTVSPASVTFLTTNWDQDISITVTGINDDYADGDVTFQIITAPATGGDYAGFNAVDVDVTNEDDDVAGLNITPASGTTSETGTFVVFSVSLKSKPYSNVTLTFSSDDLAEGVVSPTTRTFKDTNWSMPQQFTVTGVDDSEIDGDILYIVTATASSSDLTYDGSTEDVGMINTDNDIAGFTISPTSGLTTTEAGGTASFTVKLNSKPSANVLIGFTSSDTTEGTVSATPLTFTTGNWNTNQTITITGVNDALVDGDTGYTITSNPATSGDPAYDTFNPEDVSVINIDLTPTIGSFLPVQVCSGSGATIVITGSKFINVTSLSINGVSAIYTVDNPAQLTVTLPVTATTGTISVVTQTGTAVSSSSVTVNALPTATISGTITVCKNAASPSITFTGANGLSPYTFTYTINSGLPKQVSTSSGNSVAVQDAVSATGTFNYELTGVSDTNTCSQVQSGTATVTVNSLVHTNLIQLSGP